MQVVKNTFRNQNHLIKWLESQTPKKGRDNPIKQSYDKSFTTVSSWSESIEYIRKGFNDGYNKIKQAYNTNVKQYSMSVSQDYNLNKCGFAPSIPHYLAGNPLNMWNFAENEQFNHKIFNVNVDTSVPAKIEAKQIIEAGAKLLTAINALEKQGHRVGLNATLLTIDTFNNPSTVIGFSVTVKESDNAIDLKRLSYSLTCPAFQRVTKFAYYDYCCPASVYSRAGKGYSVALCDNETREKVIKAFGIKGTYITYLDIIKNDMSVDDIIKRITA